MYHLGDREETYTLESINEGRSTRVTYESDTLVETCDCCIRCIASGSHHYDTARVQMGPPSFLRVPTALLTRPSTVLSKLKMYLEVMNADQLNTYIRKALSRQPRAEQTIPDSAPPRHRPSVDGLRVAVPGTSSSSAASSSVPSSARDHAMGSGTPPRLSKDEIPMRDMSGSGLSPIAATPPTPSAFLSTTPRESKERWSSTQTRDSSDLFIPVPQDKL